MLPASVARGLSSISRFDGRDTRTQFWPYAGAVIIASFLPGLALNVVIAAYGVLLLRDPAWTFVLALVTMIVLAVIVVVMAVLLAAAVTRRLHDRGLRGWWGLPPLATLLLALGLLTQTFTSVDEPPGHALLIASFTTVLVYFVSLAVLVLQLALPSRHADVGSGEDRGADHRPL